MSMYSKLAWFAGGALFGTVGIKLLTTKDARNVYVHAAAAGLRIKDTVMETVTTVQENASDILAEAKDLNEARAAEALEAEADLDIEDLFCAEDDDKYYEEESDEKKDASEE